MSRVARSRSTVFGALLLVGTAFLTGCSLWSDRPKAAPLEPLPATAIQRTLWAAAEGRSVEGLQPAVAPGLIATAQQDGTVTVRNRQSGAVVWTGKARGALSAGVGFDGIRAAVVTQSNELVILTGGREIWRKRLPSGVQTAPLVAGERVFVLALDRSIEAYDALDGRYLWKLQRSTDPLSLRLPGILLAYGDTLVVGQGPRLMGVDPVRGSVRWDIAMATPRGTNEVERLADLVGPTQRQGDLVCARSFQSAVGCADMARLTLQWTRNTGGIQPVAFNGAVVVGGDASDRVSAWKAASGELLWSHERLLHRGLSGWAAWGTAVVAVDREGWVHVLDPQTGATKMRLATDGSASVGAPVVEDRILFVQTVKGGLFAWQAP